MLVTQKNYLKYESKAFVYVENYGPTTAADVGRSIGITFQFAKKVLNNLVDKKIKFVNNERSLTSKGQIMKRKKLADRTFFYINNKKEVFL